MKLTLKKEELNIFGYTQLGSILNEKEIPSYIDTLYKCYKDHINQYGKDFLIERNELESIRDLAARDRVFVDLICNEKLNNFINNTLNDRAVIHSYNGIVTSPFNKSSDFLGFEYHRDNPYFNGIRTSIVVMIPLVDTTIANGSTEVVPGTHLFEEKPSEQFLNKNSVAMEVKAGHAYCCDGALWHRAGVNRSKKDRPIIAIKYTLAPFKQQVDYCETSGSMINDFPDVAKQRLGWNARTCSSVEEYMVPGVDRKFKSGNYTMENTNVYKKV